MTGSNAQVGTQDPAKSQAEQKEDARKKADQARAEQDKKKVQKLFEELNKAAEQYAIGRTHHEEFSQDAEATKEYDEKAYAARLNDEAKAKQDAMQAQQGLGKLQDQAGATLSTESSILGVREDGIWRFKGLDIKLEKGQASFLKGPGDYERLIDFLRESTGGDTLYIDFPSVDAVRESQLKNIIFLAQRKGLKIDYGKNVQEYFKRGQYNEAQSRTHDAYGLISFKHFDPKAKWKEYTDIKFETNNMADEKIKDRNKSSEYQRKKVEGEEQVINDRFTKKLNDENLTVEKENIDDLQKQIDNCSKEEKIEKIKGTLDQVESRLFMLDAAYNRVSSDTKKHKDGIAAATGTAFSDLEKTIKNTDKGRKNVIAAKEKEMKNLNKLQGFCKTNLDIIKLPQSDNVKEYFVLKKQIKAISDQTVDASQQAEQENKRITLQQKQKDLKGKLSEGDKEQIRAIERLSAITERMDKLSSDIQALKTGVNDLPSQLETKKQEAAQTPSPKT